MLKCCKIKEDEDGNEVRKGKRPPDLQRAFGKYGFSGNLGFG